MARDIDRVHNGVAAATNISAHYAANVNPTEDARPPADLAVGMYNLASQGSDFEEFDGILTKWPFTIIMHLLPNRF